MAIPDGLCGDKHVLGLRVKERIRTEVGTQPVWQDGVHRKTHSPGTVSKFIRQLALRHMTHTVGCFLSSPALGLSVQSSVALIERMIESLTDKGGVVPSSRPQTFPGNFRLLWLEREGQLLAP